jgi:hypothetical protein
MTERERPQGDWRAPGAGGPASSRRPAEQRARRDTDERDRTLSRVRTTTAVTGIGAVLVGGALAGWLGHEASQTTTTDPASSSTSDSGSASSSDGGLTGPDSLPDAGSGSGSGQPGITSGGS